MLMKRTRSVEHLLRINREEEEEAAAAGEQRLVIVMVMKQVVGARDRVLAEAEVAVRVTCLLAFMA